MRQAGLSDEDVGLYRFTHKAGSLVARDTRLEAALVSRDWVAGSLRACWRCRPYQQPWCSDLDMLDPLGCILVRLVEGLETTLKLKASSPACKLKAVSAFVTGEDVFLLVV